MPGFLKSTPVSDAERRANDRHRAAVVVAVLVVLAAYVYLFTFAAESLGLPRPVDLAHGMGLDPQGVFDARGLVDSNVEMAFAKRLGNTATDLLIFYGLLVAAFLGFYYLPLGRKQAALVAGAVAALALIYGVRETAALLFAHAVAHSVFHPLRRIGPMLVPGLLAAVAFTPGGAGALVQLAWLFVLPPATAAVYRLMLRPLLDREATAPWVRGVVAHSALLAIVSIAFTGGLLEREFAVQLGVLLFFWQWCRLILYQLDYKDGLVPADLSLVRYLAVFVSPGAIPAWDWGVELGLGYAYCNNSFLCEDKNRTVLSGVRLLWIALIYLVLGDWIRLSAVAGIEALGVELYDGQIVTMVEHFMAGDEVGAASVLLTSLFDTLRWTIWFVGIVHFKTGVWRICGYRFEPYFNRPWLATNLVVFWARYTYYYREFLLQVFYYPVFLRFFKHSPRLRIVVATFAAAGAGNLIWGHVTERMYYHGLTMEQFRFTLRTWPYYVLLGGGIALTALYLLKYSRRKRRRPWTPGPRLALDVLAAYCTFQYFALIHVLSRPAAGSNEWDLFRLMLRGLGIHL